MHDFMKYMHVYIMYGRRAGPSSGKNVITLKRHNSLSVTIGVADIGLSVIKRRY